MITDSKQISKHEESNLEEIAGTPAEMLMENKIHFEERVCGGCGGKDFFEDRKTKEAICTSCGLVRDEIEDRIDHGPEWRAFSREEGDVRIRTGSPTDLSKFDKGLSTDISSGNRDAGGRHFPLSTRSQIYRLRKWQIRTRVHAPQMRNLATAMSELHRIGSQLGIPYSIRETGALIYRKALPLKLIRGRTIEGMIAAALYLACRVHKVPRPLEEFAEVSRHDRKKVSQCVRTTRRGLESKYENLRFLPNPAEEYVPKFASDLGLSGKTQALTIHILESARDRGLTTGKDPKGMAAAAIYVASIATDERRTQREIADTAKVTEVTVRNRYKELVNRGIIELHGETPIIQSYLESVIINNRRRLEDILGKFEELPDFPESHQHVVDHSSYLCDELNLPQKMRKIALWISGKIDLENCAEPEPCSSASVYAAMTLFSDLGISKKKYENQLTNISGISPSRISKYRDIVVGDFGGYEGMLNKLQLELS